MEVVTINGRNGESQVLIGETLNNVWNYIKQDNVFIITDANVKHHYHSLFPHFPIYCVEASENSKNLEVVADIFRWLLSQGADRSSFILGIGGGVVCDIAGFVASTYMRGVKFGFVATSLLAQVDASIGGKNGVNLDGYKNIVGIFNQPQFVICDIKILETLPAEEFANGFAEIVKHTLIADAQMFGFMEENIEEIKSFNPVVIEKLVNHSVNVKASIVQVDEYENGDRKKLNLGHTWGHAFEKATGLSHGKSVSIGLEFAARFSESKGLLDKRDYLRIINLLRELNLPTFFSINPLRIFDALVKDKKKEQGSVNFVLMDGIGKVKVELISLGEVKVFAEGVLPNKT
jgi:3-dehydroquinate synthase